MRDFIRSASQSPLARKLIEAALPVSLPPLLRRSPSSWSELPLRGRSYVVGAADSSQVGRDLELKRTLEDAGGRMALVSELQGGAKIDGLLFDASGIQTVRDLETLYRFFNRNVQNLNPNSRVIMLGQIPMACGETEASAVQESLTGFIRSLAKELGPKGSTANLLECADSSTTAGAIRFFMSDYSAFVTGQVLVLGGRVDSTVSYSSILSGRTILVTGAGRGIGEAIARTAVREGAKVILLDHPAMSAPLQELATELRAIAHVTDLADPQSKDSVGKKLWDHGPVHGVIHNAGITRDKTIKRMTLEQWEQVQKINFEFPIALTDYLLAPAQTDLLAKDASFVFLSSIGGISGNPGQTNYAASKSGLIGYVRAATARNFGAARKIRFNAIAPGFIESAMTASMPLVVREMGRRLNSLKQGGLPQDVAEAAVFLSSPVGAEISGQTLRVCGQNILGA